MNMFFIIVIAIVLIQAIIAILYSQMNWPWYVCLIVFSFPFGVALFLIQLLYYERFHKDWDVTFKTKLLLKYSYILTFLEFVALYLIIFVV
ncbi:hypothetical protein CD118_00985 [Staphylococcus coagulans]|uniref:hypothetical protein n=1 Tax=Staphylococcus coagulans TaxID=74706 RepID=UPI000CD3104B|nr:hypothetical protein [Staphylococcus coagulans]PNZ12931.1 hypothetical protein CD118_00985 [Staphylococcus coagulans]